MTTTIKTFPDNRSVANAFAADFVNMLNQMVETNGRVTVSLSGGSTPKLLFSILAKQYASSVDWNKVHFFWGDERCVPPTDPESNFGEAKQLFFSKIDIADENIHRIRGEDDPYRECIRYGNDISQTVGPTADGTPGFDILLLGMGDDGHTASIFPGQLDLLTSENVCEVATHPQSGQKRITITGRVIDASANVYFLVTGGAKAKALSEIIGETGDYQSYPTSHVSPEGGSVFYVDQAAATMLG